MSDYRPDWWPQTDGVPLRLLEIVDALYHIRKAARLVSGPIHRELEARASAHVTALSFACRNWQSPSTPYERAIYDLCLAAIAEAQARQEPTP
jgi:hypothetical protein